MKMIKDEKKDKAVYNLSSNEFDIEAFISHYGKLIK